MSDIDNIVYYGYEAMFAYFESQIDAGLVSRNDLDRYLLRFYGEVFDLWIEWVEDGLK